MAPDGRGYITWHWRQNKHARIKPDIDIWTIGIIVSHQESNDEGPGEDEGVMQDQPEDGVHTREGKQYERLWDHLMHEDGLFVQRASLFLLAESMLLVAHANLRINRNTDHNWGAALFLAIFGLLLSGIWWLMAARLLGWIKYIQREAEICFPEYGRRLNRWRQKQDLGDIQMVDNVDNNLTSSPATRTSGHHAHRLGPSFWIMAYVVPPMFMGLWLILFLSRWPKSVGNLFKHIWVHFPQ